MAFVRCGLTWTPSHLSMAMMGTTPVTWTWMRVLLTSSQEDTRSSNRMPRRWQESTVSAFTLPFICNVQPRVSAFHKMRSAPHGLSRMCCS